MRPRRLRFGAFAAWLGVIALSLNALVPIHLAFDLGQALETGTHRKAPRAAEDDFSRHLLTLVTGHHDEDAPSEGKADGHGKHHHADCAVCGSLSTLTGFAPAGVVPLSVPIRIEIPVMLAAIASEPQTAPAAAYHSRAPPITTAKQTT